MLGVLMGFAMGAIAFTEKGHEVGNKMWDVGTAYAKKAASHVLQQQKSTEQSPGTSGNDSHIG